MTKTNKTEAQILEDAKKEAQLWLDTIDFTGPRNEDKVLELISQRTFEGLPVVARVAKCPETAVDALKDGAVEALTIQQHQFNMDKAALDALGYPSDNLEEERQKIKDESDPDLLAVMEADFTKMNEEEQKKAVNTAIRDAYKCKWDYYYMAFYESCMHSAEISHPFTDQTLLPAVAEGLGYLINLGTLIVGVMLPEKAYRDEDNRIHHPTGPAIIWGNEKQYWWRGVQVEESWILDPSSIDAKEVLAMTNAETRRAGCEILGWEKILDMLEAEVVDTDRDERIGTLLRCDLPEAPGSQFIKVKCGTGRDFVLPVPEDMETAIQAQLWMWQLDNTPANELVVRAGSQIRT